MHNLIIGIIGQIGSGKSGSAAYLLEEHRHLKIKTYSFSTVLRKILQDIAVEESRPTLINLGKSLRRHFGPDLLGNYIAEQIASENADIFIVEGFRYEEDLEEIAKMDNFHLIYIATRPEIRYERLIARDQNPGDRNKSYEDFLADEESETEKNIKAIAQKANIVIENDGTIIEFHLRLEAEILKLIPPEQSKEESMRELGKLLRECDDIYK